MDSNLPLYKKCLPNATNAEKVAIISEHNLAVSSCRGK